jgi:uncharacterized phage protein gp47/JayE
MSKKYGLTPEGYKTTPFDMMVKEVADTLTSSLGAINLTPPSVFSVLINTFLIEVAKIDLKGEEIYNAGYPNTATGYSLDGIADYNGIKRLSATNSTVTVQVSAINYTTISDGSEVLIENTNNILLFPQTIIVNNERCNSIVLEVIDNTLSEYKLIINNIEYTYEKPDLAFISDIAEGLKLLIAANTSLIVTRAEAILTISSVDHLSLFTCFVTEEVAILSCTTNVDLIAKEAGAIAIPEKSVTTIQTPVSGWISVNNLTAGLTGRDLETDIELRARRIKSIKFSGSGTVEAMKARLLNITGVTSVKILENAANNTDLNGLPPKSFEVLVLGGSDLEIAKMIWLVKPAGIQTYGNTEITVLDSEGKNQVVCFSRSIKIYVFAKVIITKNSEFIPASIAAIKQNIVNQILKVGLGEPVIYQSLFAGVYAVDGIINANITIGQTLVETNIPALAAENILVLPSQIVLSDINKITIEVL